MQISWDTIISQRENLKPRDIYLLQFFKNYNTYYDDVIENCTTLDQKIDVGTGLLLATCPNKDMQKKISDEYIEDTKNYGSITAAAFAIGSLLSYISETMDLTEHASDEEESYGGKPKIFYLIEVDWLLEKFKSNVVRLLPTPEQRIEALTALIIAYYPGKNERESLWENYKKIRDSSSSLNATILSTGDLFTSLSKEFGLTEDAFGAF